MEPVESGKQENYFADVTQQTSPVNGTEPCYTEAQAQALKALGG